MSLIFLTNLDSSDIVMKQTNPINIPQKRWRLAFLAIYCSRALLSYFNFNLNSNESNKKKPTTSESPEIILKQPNMVYTPKKRWQLAYLAIYYSKALLSQSNFNVSFSFSVDQTNLTAIVRDKNLENLQRLGGVDGVASALETNLEYGIQGDGQDIERRSQAFGSNTYSKPPSKGFFNFVVEAFKRLPIIAHLTSAALSLGFAIKKEGLKDGVYGIANVFVAILLAIALSSICNFTLNRKFDKLFDVGNVQIDAVRSGRHQHISKSEIVVGDVICLKIGDKVPADGLLLEGYSLQVDVSSLTGESDHVEVSRSQNPFLFSGTEVCEGYGKMLVTCVGMNTTWGQMMSSINSYTYEQSPLHARLQKFTSPMEKVGLVVAFLVLLILLIRYFKGNTVHEISNKRFDGRNTKFVDIVNTVVQCIAAAVASVVVAIPEVAVNLTMHYSAKKMLADQALVRNISACETIGFTTTICTDKTGTLTLNQMKVTEFWLGQEPVAEQAYSSVAPSVLGLIQEGVALNTTGSVYKSESDSEIEISGCPTEKAILSWAVLELNMDMARLIHNSTILQVEAFNSMKRRSGIFIRRKAEKTIHVHWKGAAEMVLNMCSRYYDASGIVKNLDNCNKLKFGQIIEGMAASSLRCIAFAHTEIAEEEHQNEEGNKKVKEDGLALLGLVGIKDPCRPGAKRAVEDCQRAGVKVRMITGDNVFTAKAIATECGILQPNQVQVGAIVEGEEFRNYTQEERLEKVDNICVMARSSPFDKLLMVQCLKQKGNVVAVTGDGTNDASALKEANVGLSMGIQGTEVAKESSDIVLLDDNFASLVRVLMWGRCVYNNIQMFIQFQLTLNIVALAFNFVAAASAGEIPLTTVQVLWVNLIMDTLGALALATEKPTMELMDQPPVGRTEPFITCNMWSNLISQATWQIIVLLSLRFFGDIVFGLIGGRHNSSKTLIFNTFVFLQAFCLFNARKLRGRNIFKGILRNKMFLGIVGIIVVLQVAMVELLHKFADTESLNGLQWFFCIFLGSLHWAFIWMSAIKDIQFSHLSTQRCRSHIQTSTQECHQREVILTHKYE